MATLDIILLIIILLSAAIGLVRGLIKEILSLVSWASAFVIALMFNATLLEYIPVGWGSVSVRSAIAFIALFIGALIAASILQWLVAQLVKTTGLTGTDRFLGFLFGSARGILVAIVVLIGVREIAAGAPWYQEAQLPPELLAFEGEVRALFGQARSAVLPAEWSSE